MSVKFIGKTAFEAVYAAYADKVYRTALYYSKNHHVAEEITQAVFFKLYQNMEDINLNKAEQWLCVVAKHMALNHIKKSKFEIPVEDIANACDKKVQGDSVEEVFFSKIKYEASVELTENIFAELLRVNEEWYDALTLTCILEKPQKEVAEIMGVSYDSLRKKISRARNWIREHYEEEYDHLNKA